MKTFKKFNDIVIDEDIAFEHPDAGGEWDNEEGLVIWKGNTKQLKKSPFKTLMESQDPELYPEHYHWVVVETKDPDCILFNYDCDPCGVVCFK